MGPGSTSWSTTPASPSDTLIPRMTDEEWDEVIATNLRSVFLFTRAASQVMMRKRQRPDHQHLERLGPDGQPRPGELLGLEGGHHRPDADRGPRAGQPQDDGQRDLPRLHRHGNDGRDGRDARRDDQRNGSPPSGWARPTKSPTPCCTWPATRPPTSPARCSRSTAA